MHGISVYTRAIHHHKLIRNFLLHYCMSSRTFYNIWLRLCIAVVKVSSGLMVITDVDILPTLVAHVCMCTCFRCIPRDTVLETYRAIHFSWHLDLWLLVSCLPVLLLNFENRCHFQFFNSIFYSQIKLMDSHMSNAILESSGYFCLIFVYYTYVRTFISIHLGLSCKT